MIPERARAVVVGGGIAGPRLVDAGAKFEIDLLGEHLPAVAGDPPV